MQMYQNRQMNLKIRVNWAASPPVSAGEQLSTGSAVQNQPIERIDVGSWNKVPVVYVKDMLLQAVNVSEVEGEDRWKAFITA